eukprot:TRINITY_DN40546_c0_g1_i1.p1 TRINITY_DN40546_c0_g1~~TRINITY_DN40546_c0_g1_i1.p1  ORF type:complete len:246 (+),score=2.79 TRINITY_DN40546_c0_g1_i1:103-840(+)
MATPRHVYATSPRAVLTPFFAIVALVVCANVGVTRAADAMANATVCNPSNLSGYNYSVPLGESMTLHWLYPAGKYVSFAVTALSGGGAENGYIAVGWSPDGKMANSDAVMGNVEGADPVGGYMLHGHTPAEVIPSQLDLGTAELIQSGGLTMKFQRVPDDGMVPLVLTNQVTPSNVIWSHSADGTKQLAYHGATNRGVVHVDYSCGNGKNVAPLGSNKSSASMSGTPVLALSLSFALWCFVSMLL